MPFKALEKRIDPNSLNLKEQVVSINRVTKVVKGGKNMSFSALVVVGDPSAKVVGYGIGKAKEGTGVIAGGPVRAVIQAVGIPNVLTKSIGTHNPHNVVKATVVALELLRDKKVMAEMRGLIAEKV